MQSYTTCPQDPVAACSPLRDGCGIRFSETMGNSDLHRWHRDCNETIDEQFTSPTSERSTNEITPTSGSHDSGDERGNRRPATHVVTVIRVDGCAGAGGCFAQSPAHDRNIEGERAGARTVARIGICRCAGERGGSAQSPPDGNYSERYCFGERTITTADDSRCANASGSIARELVRTRRASLHRAIP